jgi:soluble lytic murein transglycosylase-like protein
LLQVVKVFSLAFVFSMSLIPFKGHVSVNAHPAPATQSSAVTSIGGPSIRPLLFDTQTTAGWTSIDKSQQAELAVAQAQEAAAVAATMAAAKPAAPPPAPVAAPKTVAPSAGSVQDLIRQAFAPQGQAAVDWGLRVAACESGYNPNAHNASGASGVFQFMPGTWKGTPYGNQNIFDASANVNAAAWYYQKNGGGAWSCK